MYQTTYYYIHLHLDGTPLAETGRESNGHARVIRQASWPRAMTNVQVLRHHQLIPQPTYSYNGPLRYLDR
ncbi:hypothetical protein HYQ46_000759 [Verticillium longisporum]|nr:hypothetical protein HYQ46_000759 [Verticillium longisporum]